MESPTFKLLKQQPKKKKPVDEGLRELRGIAVKIEQPEKPGDQFRKMGQEADPQPKNVHVQPIQNRFGSLDPRRHVDSDGFEFKSGHNSTYTGHQMLGAAQISHYPQSALSSMDDKESHYVDYMKQSGLMPRMTKASPRFSEVNPQVGQLISLNNRLQMNAGVVRPSFQIAFAGNFDPHAGTIQTANETEQPASDLNTASSKFVTASLGQQVKPARGRNAQSLTVEVRSNAKVESQKRAKRASVDAGQQNIQPMHLEPAPKIVRSQDQQLALRQANPQYHQFQGLMHKVITSVQNRRKQNFKFESEKEESQLLMITDGRGSEQQHLPQSDRLALMHATGTSTGSFPSEKHRFESTADIVAAARQEVGFSSQPTRSNISQEQANRSHQLALVISKEQNPPRAVEQVSYLLKQLQQDKDKIFIPLEAESLNYGQAMIFKETKNPRVVESGNIVFSKNGFLKIATTKNQLTDFITKEQFIVDGVQGMVLNNVPFFRKFHLLKNFKHWRMSMRRSYYERTRQKLAENFIFAKPIFMERFQPLVEKINETKFLELVEIRRKTVYGQGQQFKLDERCEKCVETSKQALRGILTDVRGQLENLKTEIEQDDSSYLNALKNAVVQQMLRNKNNQQQLVMFSQAKQQQEEEQQQRVLMQQRHMHYNQLCQLVSRMIGNMLVEAVYSNMKEFQEVFCAPTREQPQFELYMTINEKGILDCDPTFVHHRAMFAKILQDMEDTVFQNQQLIFAMQDLPDLFFTDDQNPGKRHAVASYMRQIIARKQEVLAAKIEYLFDDKDFDCASGAGVRFKRTSYKMFHLQFQAQLDQDISAVQREIEKYRNVQDIEEFKKDWDARQGVGRNDSDVYKETMQKMKEFNKRIAEVPDKSLRFGTITFECSTIRKHLLKIPQKIIESITHNFKGTLMEDTKQLKEELSKTSEVLDQMPVSLNIYLEQKNTLKYVEQKKDEFASRWRTVQELYEQYKASGNKPGAELDYAFEEVKSLFNDLPKLRQKAIEGLKSNKNKMEDIIKTSSMALSNKIKSFESKYIENYLIDTGRLEECAETLEELVKRSKAIHEIRSKVILYKEFLKVLYENEPKEEQRLTEQSLSCVKDCETLQEIHKHTIRLWKYLMFWKKRRAMCYQTPFLQLDLNTILRSINKVTSFVDNKLKDNQHVLERSQPLVKTVKKQVEETSVIVEFAKNLHKDALQRRHWVQIFTLLKAAHLKNSTTFTIVDLREYNIQSYSEDIKVIINQAHTESRYESVFLSIKNEWEKAEVKIVPFKESLKDFIIQNTDTMIDAIEENLGTLETISGSKFASHIRKEICELEEMLRKMLAHLKVWVQAQKYWCTLDPIYNSGVFNNFFGAKTQDFKLVRDQFRRIVWSAYRNPKATYNLMIEERVTVFNKLIEYYERLQKMVHDYLEKKRLDFTRFFFLNDSQLLDFLMLVSSNLDFSVYFTLMFRGAHKLFVTQIKQPQHLKLYGREDSLGFEASVLDEQSQYQRSQVSEEIDVETKLEIFMKQNFMLGEESIRDKDSLKSPMLAPSVVARKNLSTQKPELDLKPRQNALDPIYKVAREEHLHDLNSDEEVEAKKTVKASESDSLRTSKEFEEDMKSSEESHQRLMEEINVSDQSEEPVVSLQDFYALGMISFNKELFLFDRHIQITRQPEYWLTHVEASMKMTVRQQMKNSIERFGFQPIEEWCLDYPQQVAISSLHLILTQEINDQLQGVNYDSEPEEMENAFFEEKVTIGQIPPEMAAVLKRKPSDVTDNSKVDGQTTKSKDISVNSDKARVKKKETEIENFRQKVLRAKASREPMDEEEEKKQFYDEAFGEDVWPNIEKIYDQAETTYKKEEARQSMKTINARKQAIRAKKPEYKEMMLNVLQHSNRHSLYLRLTFWINKLVKLMFKPKRESAAHESLSFDLQGVSKMQVKSVVIFLRYMQDVVDRLINMKVASVDDFEWQYKLKTNWNADDEGEVQCGGWKMQMGYEYLSTKPRMMMMPLTERYFVFIASSLREKNAVMFQCVPEHPSAAEIVDELASFAAVPFRSVECGQHMNLSGITQLLNGCAMASVWIFLEHMDKLPLISLSILLKEIQLIQEQFAASQFQRTLTNEQGKSSGSLGFRNESNIDFGVFGSISTVLQSRYPEISDSFVQQVRSTFRTVTLQKPDLSIAFRNYLFAENFFDPYDNSRLLELFFNTFSKIKDEELYTGTNFTKHDVIHEHISVQNIKDAIKVSTLLRNQEYEAFMAYQLKLEEKELKLADEKGLDRFECITKFSDFEQKWKIIRKTKADFITQRKQKEARRRTILVEKNKIEFFCLQEGFRTVLKQKMTNEWLAARQKNTDWLKRNQSEQVDLKVIEAEIDIAIQKSFEIVLQAVRDEENQTDQPSQKPQEEAEAALPQEEEAQDKPKSIKKLTFLQMIRRTSLEEARVRQFHKAPATKQPTAIKPGDTSTKIVTHATQIDLRYSQDRQLREDLISDKFQRQVIDIADQFGMNFEETHLYNCHGILQTMRRSKGLVILGPSCSGKTQLMKLFSAAIQPCFNINLKIQYVSPTTFTDKELYGPKLAFEETSTDVKTPHELQSMSVFQVILQQFEREQLDMQPNEARRTIQSIYIDQSTLSNELTDCLTQFLRDTNVRQRDYQKESEFLLELTNFKRKAQPDKVQKVAVRFPNGNVTLFPSDVFFIFETQSLANASPVFIQQIGIVNTQDLDVTKEALFTRHLKITKEKKQEKLFRRFKADFSIIENCCNEFVLPFINILNAQPLIKEKCSLWNVKTLTNQFFVLLNAILTRLTDNVEANKNNDDPWEYPFWETVKDTLWSCVLLAFVWSFGAVLNKEMRRIFDDKFGQFKTKFNINFSTPQKQRFFLFDYFFDVERLTWGLITEKLEYRLKLHYDAHMQQIFIPTSEISQAFFVQDHLVYCIDKDKDLNKHLRLIGPSSSSKTVVLHTFATKISTPVKTVMVPLSAYLSTAKLRKIIEENYVPKRRNYLVPKDPKKRLVLVIDDVHMQRNLKVEVLEFLRSWSIAKGYFDVPAGHFKRVEDFSTIIAENADFVSTSKKSERFMQMTTTIYCEEITIDKFKPYVQTWLTSSLWGESQLVTKYYILVSNALISLCEKMKRNDSFFNSSLSKLVKFQYVAKFCQNIVFNSMNTDASEVLGVEPGIHSKRREEDAIADIFCYEAMRCFGDRIMRPSFRTEFLGKLSEICQKEFLCDKNYSPSYIENLTLGNYHIREPKAPMKMMNVSAPHQRLAATSMILEKCNSLSGNQILCSLLDAPTGLSDLYRISRILFKEKQHMTLVGLPGTSKSELVQLCTLVNQSVCFEIDVPCFGKPVQFATAFKKALIASAKLNNVPVTILISDTQLRDPVYFDYVFNFMQHYAHFEEFVLFDQDLCEKLAQAEASYIRKLKKVAMPSHEVLWRQAATKVRKNVHVVFSFSDLMSYKEIFQLFPQFEYLTEVCFLDDLASHGYQAMVDSFLARSKIGIGLDANEQGVSKAMRELRDKVRRQLTNSFYSQKMLKATIYEPCINFAAAEFIFPDDQKVTGNIFAGSGGFTVMDKDLRFTLMNLPLEVPMLNKHRFGLFLELFRYLYDLIGMHLSIHKAYYETFIAKKDQFTQYFSSVRRSKADLHQGSTQHTLQEVLRREKIAQLEKNIEEKKRSILAKQKENTELSVDLEILKQQIDDVLTAKNIRLTRIIDDFNSITQTDFMNLVRDGLDRPEITAMLDILQVIITLNENAEMSKEDQLEWFVQRSDAFIDELNHKRQARVEIPEAVFIRLDQFIKQFNFTLYESLPVTRMLYSYLIELFRKLNIKTTMESTFAQIKEAEERKFANYFSISCSEEQIKQYTKDLATEHETYSALTDGRLKLSHKIEEAEISYMRTEHIYDLVMDYGNKVQAKLENIQSRSKSLLGDCILLAASVTMLGCFSPEERDQVRLELLQYLQNKAVKIDCSNAWYPPVQTRTSKQQKSMFMLVLKDLGLRDLLKREELPAVLTDWDFAEALFSILFAPSCPVICDPTGQMERFIREKFLSNFGVEKISAADIFGNGKLQTCLMQNRAAIVTDVNFQGKINGGLSFDLQLFRRLAGTIFNGYDFHDVRTASLKKMGVIQPFFSFFNSQNKRIQTFGSQYDNISIFQAQIFQPGFDHTLNQDYTQNATYICAAPSNIPNTKLDRNKAIVNLKELLIRNLLPSASEFDEVRAKLSNLNKRMLTHCQNFENAFLMASGETLKNLSEYKQLQQAVESVIDAKRQRKELQAKYDEILARIELVSDVSRILFQLFIALKLTSKIMNEVTYSWQQFMNIVEMVLLKMVNKLKRAELKKLKPESRMDLHDPNEVKPQPVVNVEIEIGKEFFRERLLPMVHKTVMSNVKLQSVSVFNMIVALRFALMYEAVTLKEYQYILQQFIKLKEFYRWRDDGHQFIKLDDAIEKTQLQELKNQLLQLYPDEGRKIFDFIDKRLGKDYTFHKASRVFQEEIPQKYNLSPLQMLNFGFLCPDHEFKAKLTLFMYQQIESTFTFREDVNSFREFIKFANWQEPIALFSYPEFNVVNLVTSVAAKHGFALKILRVDPVLVAHHAKERLEDEAVNETISKNLLDLTNVRAQQMSLDYAKCENLAHFSAIPKQTDQVIAKQFWLSVKQRNTNLDEGSVVTEIDLEGAEHKTIEMIANCAKVGTWVLICPIQFPQYTWKLLSRLEQMRKNLEISPHFRLIYDLQGLTQSEIPDSFLFDKCVTFHVGPQNFDELPTFNDIWAKILEPQFMEALTNTAEGRQLIRNIEMQTNWGNFEFENVTNMFGRKVKDQTQIETFKAYLTSQKQTYKEKLQKQQMMTFMERERVKKIEQQRLAEQERQAKLKMAAEAEAAQKQEQASSQNNETDPTQSHPQLMQGLVYASQTSHVGPETQLTSFAEAERLIQRAQSAGTETQMVVYESDGVNQEKNEVTLSMQEFKRQSLGQDI